ncbi:MAG: NADH-quinone oxidoreductase subunit A [Polyangiaceae bacterium]|nr:NADH-quinone oxidoreductase subunit A [Polyangiaceae bacterium]
MARDSGAFGVDWRRSARGEEVEGMLVEYASVGAFFLIAIVFVFGAMLFGKLIRPNRMYAKKLATYECGEVPIGQAWFNFNPRFYIIALIYIVFDIEIAFIYPVATVFKRWVVQGSGWFAMLEILVFIGILLLGLAYVWVKGDLEWIRDMRTAQRGPQAVSSARAASDPKAPLVTPAT